MRKSTILGMGMGAVGLLALGCVSTSPTQSVVEARQTFQLTAQNPRVAQYASEQMYEAEQANAQMERALKRGRDQDEVNHLAYLTKRHSEIAQTVADDGAMKAQIEELGKRRDQLRIDASKAETREARSAAEVAMDIAAKQGKELSEMRERTAAAEQQAVDAEQDVAAAKQDAAAAERRAAAAERDAFAMSKKLELASRESDRGLVITLGDVLFKTASSNLASGAERTLSRVAELLQEYPDRAVIVEGHTDDVGSSAYNEGLSRQRAQSVTDALIANGVPRNRFEVRGLGESAPAVPNTDAASRQQNRRVEIVLSPAIVAD
jgi:outer membrane protein OmpA-like peptidoglycan-associated protein